jgi:hypothetical protein
MEWDRIRMHYAALLAAAQKRDPTVTQESVAAAGGLARQNAISKLLANNNMGPSVETFVRAVKGLGITPAAFFADLDHHDPPALSLPGPGPDPATPEFMDRLRHVEVVLAALTGAAVPQPAVPQTDVPSPTAAARSAGGAGGSCRGVERAHGRIHGVAPFPGSGTGVVNHINTFDQRDIETLVAKAFDSMAQRIIDERIDERLDRLTGDLERRRAPHGRTDAPAPAVRATHHRRRKKSA